MRTPSPEAHLQTDIVVFVVRHSAAHAGATAEASGAEDVDDGLVARLPRKCLTKETSPVLLAMVTDWVATGSARSPEDAGAMYPEHSELAAGPRGERDAEGRFVLDGPRNPHAFAVIMEAVRHGGFRASGAPNAPKARLPDLEARLEACRYADYYLLPAQVKMLLTKELLCNFTRTGGVLGEVMDIAKLGLCRSDMVLDRIHLDGLNIRGLHLENSHVRKLQIQNCQLEECELSMCVTANEVKISRSRLQGVKLCVFAATIAIEDSSTLIGCNIRVVEELMVMESKLQDCTFLGSDEDRKERQLISATFRASEVHGDVTLPFDRVVFEQTSFQGGAMKMTKAGACVNFTRARVHLLPSIEGDARLNLGLEDCDVVAALAFKNLRLNLRGVHFAMPCTLDDVEIPEKMCDISFPRTSRFRQVRFRAGLQACTASGCHFEGCNLGYGLEAVSDCLLTHSHFQACRFPFLEADSPVANFSASNFVGCQIQWNGQFPHEENFDINSCWLRKWNLAGCTVTDGH